VRRLLCSGNLLIALCFSICASPSAFASNPSFDCAKASHPDELAICGSDDLAALDVKIAEAFRDVASDKSARSIAVRFLTQRSTCEYDHSCIRRVLTEELAALSQVNEPGSQDAASSDASVDESPSSPTPSDCSEVTRDHIKQRLTGAWGLHFTNGTLACWHMVYGESGSFLLYSANCAGGSRADAQAAGTWELDNECTVVTYSQGRGIEKRIIDFVDSNHFIVRGDTFGVYFRE
jgi:uncharacterized protein